MPVSESLDKKNRGLYCFGMKSASLSLSRDSSLSMLLSSSLLNTATITSAVILGLAAAEAESENFVHPRPQVPIC